MDIPLPSSIVFFVSLHTSSLSIYTLTLETQAPALSRIPLQHCLLSTRLFHLEELSPCLTQYQSIYFCMIHSIPCQELIWRSLILKSSPQQNCSLDIEKYFFWESVLKLKKFYLGVWSIDKAQTCFWPELLPHETGGNDIWWLWVYTIKLHKRDQPCKLPYKNRSLLPVTRQTSPLWSLSVLREAFPMWMRRRLRYRENDLYTYTPSPALYY